MRAVILKCKPNAQFHFGKYAPDSDTALNDTSIIIHSDTLFAAIIRTYDSLFPDSTNEFVDQFKNGNIRISSGFLCIEQNKKNVWFLPKPSSFDLAEVEDYKSFRKIKYLSKTLWEQISNPQALAKKIEQEEVVILHGAYALLRTELNLSDKDHWEKLSIYKIQTHPKVHVHKPDKKDSIYQLSNVEIADTTKYADDLKVHYYFLYDSKEGFKDFEKRFLSTLEILSDSGIGAERATIGRTNGMEIKDWEIKTSVSNYFSSLSLLSPNQEEQSKLIYYNTIFRGGRRLGTNDGYNIQKSVRMLTEGAVFNNDILGEIRDVTPENFNGIYLRNGVSLNIAIPTSWVQ